ncbi:hypothetical protein NEMBOFW57_001572 [Staphylotrichum longicolle]|uniref:DNA-(apurinic or apyrimidinic site) endonuclease n=1 Tax=Staphylotrichum longicolle TaxID=669026 RepID=A0AAD4F1F6_9PEZI|nr:hypothetical protein NEMBOFW57_001572 [Staphylotrichum longicolle]
MLFFVADELAVNGIRNPFGYQPWRENRTFQAMFDTLEADIVVMQETKIQRKDLRDDMVLVSGWDVFFSLPKYKKAEEGITGALCLPNSSTKFRDLPEDQQIGGYPAPGQLSDSVDEQTLDSEGRCVILEFPAFVLIGLYSPATRDETRTEFREAYIDAIDVRVRNLVAMGKQVFLCGDLNIVRSELDTAGLAERLRKEGMTLDEFLSTPSRRFLNHLVFGGRVEGQRDEGREEPVLWDLCREFHPTRAGMYTCWETRKNARPGNFGSRIDYVLCSSAIKDWFIDSNIQEGLLGSDHCPVFATLGDTVSLDGTKVRIEDVMNPPGMFKDGQRQREWSPKDLLPTSAKLIPEFDRRQSIRDMFFKKTTPSTKPDPKPTQTIIQDKPNDTITAGRTPAGNGSPTFVSKQSPRPSKSSSGPVTAAGVQNVVDRSPKPESSSPEKVFDPIEAKESWSKLLGKRVVPRCEHGEDCQMLVTKKAGINCGRSFFMCARPLGPSGDKEQGTEFRCRTFIWSSDWSGRQ